MAVSPLCCSIEAKNTAYGCVFLNRVSSGVVSFDRILGGGFPVPSTLLVMEETTGAEATVFWRQMSWNLLNKGFNCLIYAMDQSADDLKDLFRLVGFEIEPFEKTGALQFADFFSLGVEAVGEKLLYEPEKVVEKVYDQKELILAGRRFAVEAKRKNVKDLLVVLDSLSPIFAAASDKKEVFLLSQTFKYITRYYKALGIVVLREGICDKPIENMIRHIADGIIEFSYGDREQGSLRVRVQKIPGAITETVPVTIENGTMLFHLPP
jgi:KaiC/GvpD/RAD55 family RecA-like ATPase